MSDPVDRSDALDHRLQDSDDAIVASLARGAQRQKLQIRVLGASIIFDLLLSGWLVNNEFDKRASTRADRERDRKAQTALVQAQLNGNRLRQACEDENASNLKQRELWGFIVDLTNKNPVPDQTPEQKKRSDGLTKIFVDKVNKTFATRDCNQPRPNLPK